MLQTPQKSHHITINTPQTASFSQNNKMIVSRFQFSSPIHQQQTNINIGIDFKAKSYQLLQKVTQLQIKQKKNQMYIVDLEGQLEMFAIQIQGYIKQVTTSNNSNNSNNHHYNHMNTVQQNSTIPTSLQSLKIEQKLTKNIEQLKKQLQHNQKLVIKYKQIGQQSYLNSIRISTKNQSLTEQNHTLKQQIRELIIQNSQLRYQMQKLQNIIKSDNNKIQEIQAKIINKISKEYISVEQYQEMVRKYQLKIGQLSIGNKAQNQGQYKDAIGQQQSKLNNSGSNDSQFSFANRKQQKLTLEQQSQRLQMQVQCYKASIQGLLEENKRLKKSFLSLYRSQTGQKLSPQLEKEINIMKSILELNNQ